LGDLKKLEEFERGDRERQKDRDFCWVTNSKTKEKFVRLVPLFEIIADSLNVGKKSKRVIIEYKKLTEQLGGELDILLQKKPEEIEKISGKKITDKIINARMGKVNILPGFDGEYGKISIE
jgi:PHP family Zn ribbon phosphoesterase